MTTVRRDPTALATALGEVFDRIADLAPTNR